MGQLVKLDNWLSLWNIPDIFQDLPKPRYPSHANSRDKESLNSSTQAKLEEQLEEQHRQGAAVQPYPVIT